MQNSWNLFLQIDERDVLQISGKRYSLWSNFIRVFFTRKMKAKNRPKSQSLPTNNSEFQLSLWTRFWIFMKNTLPNTSPAYSHIHAFFISNGFFDLGSDVASQNPKFLKLGLTLHDKKVFKTLLGMCTIILKWSHCPDLIIFRYSCFKIGISEPRVAYKSVAYERKSVYGPV